jgi:hypothetical protein
LLMGWRRGMRGGVWQPCSVAWEGGPGLVKRVTLCGGGHSTRTRRLYDLSVGRGAILGESQEALPPLLDGRA